MWWLLASFLPPSEVPPFCPPVQHKSELRRVQEFRVHPAYVQLPEDQPTSPHDLALIVLDSPVPPEFPTIALAQGAEGLEGTVPAAKGRSPVACLLRGWTAEFSTGMRPT